MKLLLVGSDYTWSLEKIFSKYLLEMQVDSRLFAAQNLFYQYYYRSLLHKLIYRAGLSGILRKIDRELRETIDRFRPDVVLVFKGMEITPAALTWIRTQRILLVNYNPDNPFIFSSIGSGNKNISRSIPLYDLHVTYNLEIKKRLESAGYPTAFMPFGFDISETIYETCAGQDETVRACFIGNPDAHRVAFLHELADKGIGLDVYGTDWEKHIKHKKIKLFPATYGIDFWKLLRRYRVQLNLMRVHNEDSHNMRTFEVPGIGGIMLAPDTTEHRLFFRDGKEVFLFSDAAHCAGLIRSILELPKAAADEIRQAARNRSIASNYSYKERTIALLEEVERAYAQAGYHPL